MIALDQIEVSDEVQVRWLDHAGGPSGWHDASDLPSVGQFITYGVIAAKDDRSITIVSSLSWDERRACIDVEEQLGSATAIASSCILSIRRIRLEELPDE